MGFGVGVCSAWLSTLHLSQGQALWRPAIVFFLALTLLWFGLGKRELYPIAWLLFMFPLVYWLAIFIYPVQTVQSVIGAAGTMLLVRRALGGGKVKFLKWGALMLFVFGLTADILLLVLMELKSEWLVFFQPQFENDAGRWKQVVIAGWQIIALTFIGIQIAFDIRSETSADSKI
jgi:hypothetical protein